MTRNLFILILLLAIAFLFALKVSSLPKHTPESDANIADMQAAAIRMSGVSVTLTNQWGMVAGNHPKPRDFLSHE